MNTHHKEFASHLEEIGSIKVESKGFQDYLEDIDPEEEIEEGVYLYEIDGNSFINISSMKNVFFFHDLDETEASEFIKETLKNA